MPEPVKPRPLVVFLATCRDLEFPEANAYAFTGPNDRDLELFDRDWEQHINRRSVACFAAGGWLGLMFGDVSDNTDAKRSGFRVEKNPDGPVH